MNYGFSVPCVPLWLARGLSLEGGVDGGEVRYLISGKSITPTYAWLAALCSEMGDWEYTCASEYNMDGRIVEKVTLPF